MRCGAQAKFTDGVPGIMSKLPLRVGVIGCGFFAENHLAAWNHMPDVTLAAVCDLDPVKAHSAAKRYRVRSVFSSAAELLDSGEVDFVDIATTMRSHVELVSFAAARRIPVIVQKPLAPSHAECLTIIEICAAAGVPFMVHENTRFLNPVRKVREDIASGALGDITWGRVAFRTGHDIYDKQPYLAQEDNFVILDLGVHMLDVVGAVKWVIDHKNFGVFNLTHPEVPPAMKPMFDALGAKMGKEPLEYRNELLAPSKPVAVDALLGTGFTLTHTVVEKMPDA